MERNYIAVNFPNLVSVLIMTATIVAVFTTVRKFSGKKASADE